MRKKAKSVAKKARKLGDVETEIKTTHRAPKPDADYEVGYGRPPKANWFPPGVSGNPLGPKRGQRSLATLIDADLNRKVSVVEQGKRKRLTKREVIAKQLVSTAMRDPKAALNLLQIDLRQKAARDEAPAELTGLTPQEREMLQAFLVMQEKKDPNDEE